MASKNQVTLTFAGDAEKLAKAAKDASQSTEQVGQAAKSAGTESSKGFDKATFAAVGLADSIGNASDVVDSVKSAFRAGSMNAARLARAQTEVEQTALDAAQAEADLRQSTRDAAQASIDAEQAQLDALQAQKDYNAAVKEFGKGSIEAKQALIDQKQAQEDYKQAQEDGKQATIDGKQATVDAKNAQLDMADAQTELTDASGWRGWLDTVAGIGPAMLATASTVMAFGGTVKISTIAQKAAAAASRVWAAAQWLLNAAMRANPIGIVITVLSALVGGIVLAYKKSETFRKIVQGAWKGIQAAAKAVGGWFKNTLWPWIKGVWNKVSLGARAMWALIKRYWNAIKDSVSAVVRFFRGTVAGWISGFAGRVRDIFNSVVNRTKDAWRRVKSFVVNPVRDAVDWVKRKLNSVISFIAGMPARVRSKASSMFEGIKSAFKSAVNWLIRKWNNLSFTFPSIDVPGVGRIGGQTISTPNIRELHGGGIVPGSPGQESLALLQAGERVTPAGRASTATVIEIRSGGSRMDDLLVEMLRKSIKTRGGDVQVVLGRG